MKVCKDPDCGTSRGVCDNFTHGKGKLDANGYWEFPCEICERMGNMRVAFDVVGTLDGGGEKVHNLFKWFESKGCEMIIWSSNFQYKYALKVHEQLGYNAEVMHKRKKLDKDDLELNPDYNVDIAVDDDNFIEFDGEIIPTIACNHMIPVRDIPENKHKFEEMFGHLLKNSK